MELAEIEALVAELESRLDRLRSLYDQYFMGIEKLEPNVPRKDIDRRIFVLRKVQIRNTGIRFRFQMILQRYNTYQTYWQRICRKIDDGTYKRHMLRAEARFGEGVGGPQRRSKAPSAAPPPPPPTTPSADDHAWLDEDFPEPALPRIAPPPVAGVSLPPASASFPAAAPITSKWRKAPPAEARSASPPPPLVAPPTAAPAPPPLPKQPPPLPAAANASKAPPSPVAPTTSARPLPAPSRFTRPPVPTSAAPPKPATPPPPAPPKPATPAPPKPAPPKAAPPAPAPAPPPAPPPPPAPRPSPASDLPDDRVRQIYAQYVDTKRKQNESTAAITFDALAKSLRESSAKLREKHGRSIDFEVAVKDGKTILKPVVK